jgi:hypothetical protein
MVIKTSLLKVSHGNKNKLVEGITWYEQFDDITWYETV